MISFNYKAFSNMGYLKMQIKLNNLENYSTTQAQSDIKSNI